MPLLCGDYEKFLREPARTLKVADFEALRTYGLVSAGALTRLLTKHQALFNEGGPSDSYDRQRSLEAVTSSLRRLLWSRNLLARPRWVKSYVRKILHYSVAPLLFPPVSLAVRTDVPPLVDKLRQETEGTYIDVLHSYALGRRLLPKRPTIGIAVHVGPGPTPGGELAFAKDAWGITWRKRLGQSLPVDVGSPSEGAVYRAVQYVFDSLYSV
jgi:hypothetical protein